MIAWADKFRFEQRAASIVPQSVMIGWGRHAELFGYDARRRRFTSNPA